jgi:hypothetical protein
LQKSTTNTLVFESALSLASAESLGGKPGFHPTVMQQTMPLLKEHLERRALLRLRIVSASMSPILRPGDDVLVARCSSGELRPGDIVALQSGNSILVHRLLKRIESEGEEFLVIRGGAELKTSQPWSSSLLLGRVIASDSEDRAFDFTSLRWRAAGRAYAWLAAVWTFRERTGLASAALPGQGLAAASGNYLTRLPQRLMARVAARFLRSAPEATPSPKL